MHLRTPATVCCCVFLWTLMLWPLDCCMLPRMCSTLMHRLGEPRVSLTLPSLMLLPLQLFLFHWSVLTRVHSINSDELIDLIWFGLLHCCIRFFCGHDCCSWFSYCLFWACWHECTAALTIVFHCEFADTNAQHWLRIDLFFFFALLHSCVRLFCCHDYCSWFDVFDLAT